MFTSFAYRAGHPTGQNGASRAEERPTVQGLADGRTLVGDQALGVRFGALEKQVISGMIRYYFAIPARSLPWLSPQLGPLR